MDLNINANDIKVQIHGLLGKLSKSPDLAPKAKKSGAGLKTIAKPALRILGKYSYEHETVLGVELTPHYVRVCQMQKSYDQWMFNTLASSCIESQFRNMDIFNNVELYVENLKDLVSKNKLLTKDVAFTLPTSSSIIKVLRIPEMDDADFDQAAAMGSIWESMVSLNGSIGEYSVYYKILRHNPAPVIEELPVIEVAPIQEYVSEHVMDIVPDETIVHPLDAAIIQLEIPMETAPLEQPQEYTAEIVPTEIPMDAVATEVPLEQPQEFIAEAIPSEIPMDMAMSYEAIPEPAPLIGPTMDVLFVASKLADIYLHADIIRRAGLNPVLCDIKCLALKHAFESNKDNFKDVSRPYAFMEFGPDENYIFVVDGDSTDIYPLYVSDDDKNALIYSAEDAARLSLFIQNYAAQAEAILIEHEKKYGTSGINSIFVSSSAPLHVNDASAAPLIKTFVREISKILGRRITECDFCSHIVVPEKFAKQVNAEGNIAAWAGTVGIASRRVDIFDYDEDSDSLNHINLFPGCDSDKKTKCVSIISTLCLAAVLGVALTLMGMASVSVMRYGYKLAEEVSNLGEVEKEYNTKLDESTKLTVVMSQVNSLDNIKDSLPSNQSSIISAYKYISEVIPEGIWLQEVSYKNPDKMEITGNAVSDNSILNFVDKLNQGTEFTKVSLKTMEMEEQKAAATAPVFGSTAIKKFTLEGTVKGSFSAKTLEMLTSGAKHGS